MKRLNADTESQIVATNFLIAQQIVSIAEASGVFGFVQVATLPVGSTKSVTESLMQPDGNGYTNSVIAPIGESFLLEEDDGSENLLGLNGLKTATIFRTGSHKDTGEKIRGESNYPGKRLITGPVFYCVISLTTNDSNKNNGIIAHALMVLNINN